MGSARAQWRPSDLQPSRITIRWTRAESETLNAVLAKKLMSDWKQTDYLKAAECLERALERLLTFHSFPAEHARHPRTTNRSNHRSRPWNWEQTQPEGSGRRTRPCIFFSNCSNAPKRAGKVSAFPKKLRRSNCNQPLLKTGVKPLAHKDVKLQFHNFDTTQFGLGERTNRGMNRLLQPPPSAWLARRQASSLLMRTYSKKLLKNRFTVIFFKFHTLISRS